MERRTRIFHLILFILVLWSINYFVSGSFAIPTGDTAIWIHSGLLMIILGMYWVEKFFTRPSDVVINCLIVFIAVTTLNSPPYEEYWQIVKYYSLFLLVISFLITWLGSPALPENDTSKFKKFLYIVVTRFGSAQVIFSFVFILALLSYFDLNSIQTKVVLLFWAILLSSKHLDFSSFFDFLKNIRTKNNKQTIGLVNKICDPNIIYFSQYDDVKCLKGAIVGFTQNGKIDDTTPLALVIGHKISPTSISAESILIDSSFQEGTMDKRHLAVRIDDDHPIITQRLESNEFFKKIKQIIAFTYKNSNISQLYFEIIKRSNIEEGHLVGVQCNNNKFLLFQVINGMLHKESSIDNSDRAFTIGEAEQLGTWNNDKQGFETYSWVVPENSPVFHITKELDVNIIKKNKIIDVGIIPNSNLPVNIDLRELVLYHSAVLGVTGSGKSFLAYNLIEECAKIGVKVICLDVTGDYKRYLRNPILLNKKDAVKSFLDSQEHTLGIAEFVDKSIHPILATHKIANIALEWCENNRQTNEIKEPTPKVLLVLEEAHTLIPEWNSNPERNLQDVVNKTAKITLQARKYGLGFMIITQRTANVTKSILNQCNTIFAFQAYDETGFEFMKNYMGDHYIKALPNLKKRQGVIVGKASVSDRPVITRFHDQDRETSGEEIPEITVPIGAQI